MPLMRLKDVARELGYRSVESVYNLIRRGELKVHYLPVAGGRDRAVAIRTPPPRGSDPAVERPLSTRKLRGSPRIDSAEVEAFKLRASRGESRAVGEIEPVKKPGRKAQARFRASSLLHFE